VAGAGHGEQRPRVAGVFPQPPARGTAAPPGRAV